MSSSPILDAGPDGSRSLGQTTTSGRSSHLGSREVDNWLVFIHGGGQWFDSQLNSVIGGGRRAPVFTREPGKTAFHQQNLVTNIH